MKQIGIATVWLPLLVCCVTKDPANKFVNPVHRAIAEFQDRRQADSLYQFFQHENPEVRRDAVLAFASIQDSNAVAPISKLLMDTHSSVSSAAAFTLGQIGTPAAFDALIRIQADSLTPDEIQEGIGKTARPGPIPANMTAWGLYRLAIRGLADSSEISQAIIFLQPGQSENIRLGAAHFFARGPSGIQGAQEVLSHAVRKDSSVFVRMASAQALRKIKTPEVLNTLKEIITSEVDYRVRVNAVRSLQAFSFTHTKQTFFSILDDTNINVAIASAEGIKIVAGKDDFPSLVEKARTSANWRVKANLYGAALAVSNHKELAEEISRVCGSSENPYEKAALLEALSHSPMSFGFVQEQLFATEIPVIRSTAASTLVAINKHKLFEPSMQHSFSQIYRKALSLNDPAVIGTVASALADSALGYRKFFTDYQFLYEAKGKLSLPKDNEALQPLEAAIAHFEGKKIIPAVRNEYNHPLDWDLITRITKDQLVLIKTEKGNIVMRLLVEEAPGSVANFVQLAESNYFDGKNFHRVVPNFVIQGGCNRGDGWGSEDYSIRSEFSMRRYKEGSVGMASAGKDTEGTQWFITHSPTPHLDGRYTIFAEVISGMEVVHRIEVGDKILDIELMD